MAFEELNQTYIHYLIQIQDSLEELWPIVDFYNSQIGLRDYSVPIIEASFSVERMIILLAIERGCEYDHGQIKNPKDSVNQEYFTPLVFASNGYLEDIPQDIIKFVNTIRRYRNITVHYHNNIAASYGEAVFFAEAFDCFVGWFIVNSITLKNIDTNSREKFLSRIHSFSSKIIFRINSGNSEKNDFVLSTTIPQAKKAITTGENIENTNSKIEEQLGQALELIGKVASGVMRIEKKVDEIADKLEQMAKVIGNYQSLLSRQIDKAINEDEIERVISAYTDECTGRIVQELNNTLAAQDYSVEKEKLLLSMGETAWNKLDPTSQNFLITAKVTYNKLITMHDVIDYSGVCLLVTKAIEVEMNNRFCRDYLLFLKNKYPGRANNILFPTPLLNQYGKPIRIKDFTLGSVAYVLCYYTDAKLTSDQIENNHSKLIEFVSECLMLNQDENTIDQNIEIIAENVEKIRKDYRNPSAHTNQLQYVDAKQCFDLVLDVEKVLKTILDLLAY